MTTQRFAFIALLGCVLPSTALAQAPASGSASDPALLQRMLDAEDARARDSSALAPLLAGLRSPDVATRRAAARGIGRMERLENMPALEPMVTDSSPLVRAEAINAIGQIAKAVGSNHCVLAR